MECLADNKGKGLLLVLGLVGVVGGIYQYHKKSKVEVPVLPPKPKTATESGPSS
jgi:hypothetical protein